MQKLFFLITLLTSTSLFAATMADHKKLSAADKLVRESDKLKGFTLHSSKLEFSTYTLRYLIPITGQIDAYFDYAKEGDQDVQGYRAQLSKGIYDYELVCVLKSERKVNFEKNNVRYKVELSRCELNNVQHGSSKDIGYLLFKWWYDELFSFTKKADLSINQDMSIKENKLNNNSKSPSTTGVAR